MIEIRDITEDDSRPFAKLIMQLALETPYSLLTPLEAEAAASTQLERARLLISSPNQSVALAYDREQLVGFIALTQGTLSRNQHVSNLMMGVLLSHQSQGIGSRLLETGLVWCMEKKIHRIELGVMAENHKALGLYKKFGFIQEGQRTHALLIDGQFFDELILCKIL